MIAVVKASAYFFLWLSVMLAIVGLVAGGVAQARLGHTNPSRPSGSGVFSPCHPSVRECIYYRRRAHRRSSAALWLRGS